MTTEQTTTLILKDQAGEYYLLPQATLERARVPEEHKAEVERIMALDPSGDAANDVQGHYWWVALIPVVVDAVSKEVSGGKNLWEMMEEYRNR